MYLNHPKVSRYHYSKYHINVQQDSRKTCSPTISNKLLKLSNTSCDFSERASITIYLPRIICKSFNSEWLSKSKILNKQTKWEESISLAGILANANFTSWKKKIKIPQCHSENGSNHSNMNQRGYYYVNHSILRKRGSVSLGVSEQRWLTTFKRV